MLMPARHCKTSPRNWIIKGMIYGECIFRNFGGCCTGQSGIQHNVDDSSIVNVDSTLPTTVG